MFQDLLISSRRVAFVSLAWIIRSRFALFVVSLSVAWGPTIECLAQRQGAPAQRSSRDAARAQRANIAAGKAIFDREFEFVPAKEPFSNQQLKEIGRLSKMPGDGLGPMFNARSCVACHAGGGGADVDRNVTLLAVDPRSPLIKSANAALSQHIFQSSRNGNHLRAVSEARRLTSSQFRELFPPLIRPSGLLAMEVVVHESSTRAGYEKIRSDLSRGIAGGVSPAWFDRKQRTSKAIADQPVIAGRMGEIDYYLSQRNSPPLFGLGKIDRITRVALEGVAERQAKATAGRVSGRVGMGKFGWRAQTATLGQFVQGACVGELGLQLPESPQPLDVADASYVSFGRDLKSSEVQQLVSFVKSIPAPTPGLKDAGFDGAAVHDARLGQRLFSKIGCQDCHVETISPAKELYSDLLLHDMGKLLQAASPAPQNVFFNRKVRPGQKFMTLPMLEPSQNPALSLFTRQNEMASGMMGMGMGMSDEETMEMGMGGGTMGTDVAMSGGRGFEGRSFGYNGGTDPMQTPVPYVMKRPAEPRFPYGDIPEEVAATTTPKQITWDSLQREWRTPPLWGVADTAPYLHDGRARTLDAAIRWHGGEATESATQYRSLTKEDQAKLIAFLKSLRAPNVVDKGDTESFEWIEAIGPPKDEPKVNKDGLADLFGMND